MPRQLRQNNTRRTWDFLIEHARNGLPFSIADLTAASGWTPYNTETNLSKRLSDLVRKQGAELYASPEILRVRYEDFKDLFRQKQRLFTDYELKRTSNVLVYEFFMPLTREDRLREALDNLFYRDTIEQRIREIGTECIRQGLGLDSTLPDEEVRQFVIRFIKEAIGGYSLSLVSGRFRHVDSLITREEVAARPFSDGPYLVDETTAVVRFILHLGVDEQPIQGNLFEPAPSVTGTSERAEQMRWLFLHFFAEAVTRVVRNEDEIWLLETGMANALYRWVRREE